MGSDGSNNYEKIKSIVMLSTDDMVNWTYHGIIDIGEISPLAIASWAPSIVSRVEDDGKTHFYLYYSNSGCGVGVVTAEKTLVPWTDPLGEPLVSTSTKGLKNCPNPFDPGVCLDENGVGWLTFGEREAILGAKRHIENGAKILCSLYHRNEDMFELPLLIKSINPELKFYVRHQLYIPAWETNLYAVSKGE